MMNQGPEAGLFCFPFYIYFIFVRDLGPLPKKIVGQIRGVFSFGGTLSWVTSPSWPPPKPTAGSASGADCDLEVLWVELKQILHLKVSCSDVGPVQDSADWQFTLPNIFFCHFDFST